MVEGTVLRTGPMKRMYWKSTIGVTHKTYPLFVSESSKESAVVLGENKVTYGTGSNPILETGNPLSQGGHSMNELKDCSSVTDAPNMVNDMKVCSNEGKSGNSFFVWT